MIPETKKMDIEKRDVGLREQEEKMKTFFRVSASSNVEPNQPLKPGEDPKKIPSKNSRKETFYVQNVDFESVKRVIMVNDNFRGDQNQESFQKTLEHTKDKFTQEIELNESKGLLFLRCYNNQIKTTKDDYDIMNVVLNAFLMSRATEFTVEEDSGANFVINLKTSLIYRNLDNEPLVRELMDKIELANRLLTVIFLYKSFLVSFKKDFKEISNEFKRLVIAINEDFERKYK